MIDPLHSLAFSIQANPGVYAVLIGSGVSRSAQIPTGWEITLDLVRKLAAVAGESCDPAPALWYQERYGKEPDYSELLDKLAKTPTERQQLLRAYLEPSEEERAAGLKTPTAAHKAIANLVAKGHIRVIITTNFDRLMETALADVGVVATVLSSPDQVQGAMPLIHTGCCVFKVHGDYLDSRIRNTPAELAGYPKKFNDLLDRIFDDFGLIVCGWSAEWDTALRASIEKAKTRRFSYFWAVHGELGSAALRLMEHRKAQRLPITNADNFFSELWRLVEALEQFSRPHPLSTAAAVASLKGYLAEPKYRIRLADLISSEVDRVLETTSGPAFSLNDPSVADTMTFTARVRAYEAACETLIAMATVGGYWVEDWHYANWQTALTRLATRQGEYGLSCWIELQRYPSTLLLYALGLGAVTAGERGLIFLGKLLSTAVHLERREEQVASQILPPFCLFGNGKGPANLLEGMGNRHAPLNVWIHDLLQPKFSSQIPSSVKFTCTFDKLEVLLALNYAYRTNKAKELFWGPPGCYGYRKENLQRILKELDDTLTDYGDKSPYILSQIFGTSVAECRARIDSLREMVPKLYWY